MKHIFLPTLLHEDGATATKGGTEIIIEKMNELGAKQTEAINGVKAEVTKLNAKAEDHETRLTESKSLGQKALEVAEDTQKQLATVKNLGNSTQQPITLSKAIKNAMEPFTDDITKMSIGDKSVKSISIPVDIKAVKAVGDISLGANMTGGSVWGSIYRPGIIEAQKRKVHMRDVLPGGNIGPGTDYYFMRQNGLGEGSIAFTAEGGTKPQFDADLVEASVKIENLAGWARVTRKAMNNVPGFMTFMNSFMVEKLKKAEDAAILYGDGVSPNIKGILTSGNFTASTSTATILAERIIDDLAALEDTYERDANIILLRPQQYYGFFKNKASGSGEYDLPQNVVIANGQLYISGVLAVPTTALNINTAPTPDTTDYVVGDVNGASFLTQESMRIEIFEQDGTNVRENKITVRIEETVALPVYGSTYFISGAQNVTI